MLVLERKVDQGFWIEDRIFVKILGIGTRRVKIGIEAPLNSKILRDEVRERDNQASGGGQDVPQGYAPMSILSEGSQEPYDLDASATQIMRHYENPAAKGAY